jgi:lipoprotein Spr
MKKIHIVTIVSLSLLFSTTGLVVSNPIASAQVAQATHDNIIQTAESYIGKVRYRYSTRDSQHLIFDCSSFTQFVFKKNGIDIPWGSKAQSSFGTPVRDKSYLRVGDLIMFSVGTPGRINHVGIYIGNGKFISNTPSSGVVINELNSGYWKDRFITGRHY